MNVVCWSSLVWWETDQSLLVQPEAKLIYMHTVIRITHKCNIVDFCEAKYEQCWYFHQS